MRARAREMQAEYFVDELSLIADDGRNDFMRRVREHGEEFVAVDREHLERSKIRIGTRQWIIERILANKYGPKPQVVVNNQQNVVSSIGLTRANSDRYCAIKCAAPVVIKSAIWSRQ